MFSQEESLIVRGESDGSLSSNLGLNELPGNDIDITRRLISDVHFSVLTVKGTRLLVLGQKAFKVE